MGLLDENKKICETEGRDGKLEVHRVKGGYSIRVPDTSKPLKLQDLPLVAQLLLEAFHKEINRRKK